MTVVLAIRGLSAGYRKATILEGISLSVQAGEIATVLGPNGAGKSTLLKAILNQADRKAGLVHYNGLNTEGWSTEECTDRRIALVPEQRELFSTMSVIDNLRLGAYLRYRRRDREIGADLESIFGMFPVLGERKGQLAGSLSGGEQQMLTIGRALMTRPKLLLLDEPSTGLAPRITDEILATIRRITTSMSMAVLLVEQSAKAALAVSDRAYVLELGHIVREGTAMEINADARISEMYMGNRDRYAHL